MIDEVNEILKENASLEREYLELIQISDEMNLSAEIHDKLIMGSIAHSLAVIADALADRKTEPTISKMEQVDEPKTQTETQNSNLTFKTLEYCDICDHKGCEECVANALDEHCIPSQFKKQIEDECAKEYEELGLKELKELIEADRKTENSSEKPNNCDTCRHNKLEWYSEVCDGCSKAHSNYEPKDESQNHSGEVTEMVKDEPQSDEDCDYCKMTHKYWYEHCDTCKHKPKDEPQTDCDHKCIQTEIGCEKTDCAWK